MKSFLRLAGIAVFALALPASWGQASCRVAVQSTVEVTAAEVSLADLLAPTCAALREKAASVRLGATPLPGSVRVLTGAEVRELLEKVADSGAKGLKEISLAPVPDRITVRGAGPRASCTEIKARILNLAEKRWPGSEGSRNLPAKPDADVPSSSDVECGAAGRIPRDASVEVMQTIWNPALASWDVSARCTHPADCVPFLVRIPGQDVPSRKRAAASSPAAEAARTEAPVVRPGESVTLLWDQGGIRLVVPAFCLDRGGTGESVRARIAGGRLVRAIVESAGRLRMAS